MSDDYDLFWSKDRQDELWERAHGEMEQQTQEITLLWTFRESCSPALFSAQPSIYYPSLQLAEEEA